MRRHLQGTGRELRVELLRGVDGDLGALTERSLQLPWVVRVAELGIVLDLVKVALPEFVRVRLLVPLVRALSLGGRDVVGEVLDGELAEAQGLIVVAAAAPAPGEASSGAPAAVVEPAALGRPRGRAAVVAVIAVERGSAAGGRAPALESAAAGTAAIIELLPGRGRTGRQRRSVHRERSKIPEGRRSRSVRDGRDTRGDYASEAAVDTGWSMRSWKGADPETKWRNGFARCRSADRIARADTIALVRGFASPISRSPV
jgi:hypothetical protein